MAINTFDDRRQLGAFKEAITASFTPVVALKFPYNINATVNTNVTASGTVTQASGKAIVSTGAASSSSAQLLSHEEAIYQPGQGVLCRFTAVFSSGVVGNTQLIGVGNGDNGYFIGFDGADFGVMRRSDSVEDWTYLPHVGNGHADFVGQIDFTKGNIYQIQYQWLGFGCITFSVSNPDLETFEVLHIIKYPNTATVPSALNSNTPFQMIVANTTNDTDITLATASAAIFIEGKLTTLGEKFAIDNSKTITTETNILTIRSRETYGGSTNHSVSMPDYLSVAADGTKSVKVRVYLNTTLGGTPSWTNVDTTNSVMEYDIAGTTVTGGRLLLTFVLGKEEALTIKLEEVARLHNLETLTITAESVNSSVVDAGVSWRELQ